MVHEPGLKAREKPQVAPHATQALKGIIKARKSLAASWTIQGQAPRDSLCGDGQGPNFPSILI